MDSFYPLLERTRLPQPSLQKLAVISIFEKLRSPSTLTGPESDPGIHAVTQCLNSNSPAVVDQSVRELCLLVKDSKLKLSRGLMELQSALDGSDSRFVNVFVKAIGFLVQLGFRNDHLCFRFQSSEAHPFVKIISCRIEVQSELVRQVLMFISQNRHLGMEGVCEFLKPFLNLLVIQMSSSATMSSLARNLLSSIASLCCSFPQDAIPVFKLLMGCCKYVQCNNTEDVTNVSYLMEAIVDAFVGVLSHLAANGVLIHDAQLCGAELLEMVFSLYTDILKYSGGEEGIFDMSRRLIGVQAELGLKFIPEASSVMLSLFVNLIHSEIEHIQLSILKLVLDLIKWKSGNDTINDTHEEILFVFPAINLMSSPSRYIKEAASELLIILKELSVNFLVAPINEVLMEEDKFPRISRLEDIIFRVFRHLWFQDQTSSSGSFYLNLVLDSEKFVEEKQNLFKSWSWTASITEYCQNMVEIQKSSLPKSQSQEILPREIPALLGAIASVVIVHPTLGNSAVDLLAVTGNMDPKLGVPLFLVILFYQNIFSGKSEEMDLHDILLKILRMLPSLVSHPAMIPLVVQSILPMLQKDANPVLYATALRLLCKTWEINDRIFGSLQGLLLPEAFTQFKHERSICISMAVTVRDVCKKNPDRGVDIILSVEACIESTDAMIQALGIQSLALLCEADVIDFYTAWGVIKKYVVSYLNDPVVANSICLLLRWGAMDAEAYPENATSVLQILWEIATSRNPSHGSLWANARESAFEALTQYEVHHLQQFIPDFREKNIQVLVSEIDPKVLGAMERFEAKIITHQHITRRRVVKEKRLPANKIEKLLDVFPRVIGISGTNNKARELPGAALFHLSFGTKDENTQRGSKVMHDLHSRYENALMEIAASLQLSRNIIVALVSLQSWKPFLQHWMRACVMLLDVKKPSNVLDTASKAADDILKCMRQMAEKSIPRSAENIGLAMGALCLILPPSAHATKASASKFLLSWLFQHEHEYRQWSAAISLGVISSCLHVTDHKQKFQNINALVEAASTSKSTLVRGACGAALGYSCQDLLTRIQVESDSHLDKELQESDLLGKIVRTLCGLINQYAQSSSRDLQTLSEYFPSNTIDPDIAQTFSEKTSDYLEEDIWGVSGLVIGLGGSIPAIYRSGRIDVVKKIKDLIISWIPLHNMSMSENLELVLSMGACLALPFVVSFSQKVELIEGAEIEYFASGYRDLINELLSTKNSEAFRQSLLMAACVGAGNFVGCVLNEGIHSLDAKCVKDLLDMFKKIYSNRQPPLMHLGAMLGVVNALGAGAGTLFLNCPLPFSPSVSEHKESCYMSGPLLSNTVMELHLTSLIQDIFLVGQNSDDQQLQQYAAWSVSFVRHYIWSSDLHNAKPNSASASASQSFPDDSIVLKLSLWLMNLNYSQTTTSLPLNTIATVLRCLTHAPRLPQLDWGPLIRRCMRYESDSVDYKEKLREECLVFSLFHGSNFNALLTFLDELCDFSRFKMLEMNLQMCILSHLPHTLKIFSGSRLEKLLNDLTNFIQSPFSSDQSYNSNNNPEQKSLLRKSFWKGIRVCFEEASLDSEKLMVEFEDCMEVLFSLLPQSSVLTYEWEEWSEAVKCLGKARGEWLSHCLEIPAEMSLSLSLSQKENIGFLEAKKKMIAKARLVKIGCIPLIELSKLKPYIFNTRSDGIWDVLMEVVMALQHAEGSVKRQWLVDAAEISCVTDYPITGMQFMGLLCGSVSKYMPLLIVNPHTVLSDLPLTLTSLLLHDDDDGGNWGVVAEPLVLLMWTLTNRIYDSWVTNANANTNDVFLLKLTHHTCVALKHHLPPDKQLLLANMTVP
ncbi:protein RST1 isoform X1 [Lactuca sativa]|uniref:protein RST1 isoform X1 n=2 Tax=Lactuca sativa TaxID=4236 RepID=UPI000CC7B614|nr:protein RST1 isoform X1 [Lactuca sativa]